MRYTSNASGATWGVFGSSNSNRGIGICGTVIKPTGRPIVAQGASGQTANLQEWQNNAGTALSVVDKDGQFGVGKSNPEFKIHVVGIVDPTSLTFDSFGNVASNIIGRRAQGTVASPSACQTDDGLLVLNGRGYGATGFSDSSRACIRLCASQNWTDTAQGAYIRFETTPNNSTTKEERMRIDNHGDVIPPSDGAGSIGTEARRWGLIRGVVVTSGDLVFENGVKATEEGDGLAFMNKNGNKIAVLDNEGNLQVKGKITENPNL